VVIPVLAVVLALHGAPWKHAAVTRHAGELTATMTYESRPDGIARDLRNLRLRLVQRGRVVFDHALATRGTDADPTLTLANVWGNADQEAIVALAYCGNRCWDTTDVVIADTSRVVSRQFGLAGWTLDGDEFVSADSRFFGAFSDNASAGKPVQVLSLNSAGTRFVDVSRSRPDLLRRDAKQLWRYYVGERRSHTYTPAGMLVPYCADEYRRGVTAYCDRRLRPAVKRQLTAWGYR
jgi:hypothetical protein